MPTPKHGNGAGIDFSPNGSMMAILLKNSDETLVDGEDDGSDVIGLFSTRGEGQWECIHRFCVGSN